MAWNVVYNPGFGIIEIVFTAIVDAEQTLEATVQSVALSREKDTDLFLSDWTQPVAMMFG